MVQTYAVLDEMKKGQPHRHPFSQSACRARHFVFLPQAAISWRRIAASEVERFRRA
jgi:hypothetical protein